MSSRPKWRGSEGSGATVWHLPKAKATWSPDARGVRDGDSVRGACAFPYRNKQQVEAKAKPAASIEIAERLPRIQIVTIYMGFKLIFKQSSHSDQTKCAEE